MNSIPHEETLVWGFYLFDTRAHGSFISHLKYGCDTPYNLWVLFLQNEDTCWPLLNGYVFPHEEKFPVDWQPVMSIILPTVLISEMWD